MLGCCLQMGAPRHPHHGHVVTLGSLDCCRMASPLPSPSATHHGQAWPIKARAEALAPQFTTPPPPRWPCYSPRTRRGRRRREKGRGGKETPSEREAATADRDAKDEGDHRLLLPGAGRHDTTSPCHGISSPCVTIPSTPSSLVSHHAESLLLTPFAVRRREHRAHLADPVPGAD